MRKFVPLIVLLFVWAPFFAQAQVVDPSDITNMVNFVISPENPGPNQSVRVAIEAYGFDLNTSDISWSVNDAVVKEGVGITSINFTTGVLGSSSTVSVSIDTGSGIITQSTVITPGSVDLIWKGNVYAPPFYGGRTLWGYESPATIVAIPHVVGANGNVLSPSGLIYRWSQDGNILGNSSGIGKNSLQVTGSVLALPTTISVDVMTDSSTVVANADLTLNPTAPSLLVYEDNPLYGLILNNAIGDTTTLNEKEVSFTAMPLYMRVTERNAPAINYTWTVNGGSNQYLDTVTYRAPDNTSGSSQIHVDAINHNTTLESASKDFLVQFGNGTTF